MAKMCGDAASARREEIINACAALYETMNFKDVTLKEVGGQDVLHPHPDLLLLPHEGGDLPGPAPAGA